MRARGLNSHVTRHRPHMWQSGTPKVTPYAGTGSRWYWSYRHHWQHPEARRAAHRARDLERWKNSGIRTGGDAARTSTIVARTSGQFFRLIDAHGRAHGPRYQNLFAHKPGGLHDKYACQDPRGKVHWMVGTMRCRVVERAPEDPHSAVCRALKRAHRLGLES